jgi:hypothetical protein
MSSVIVLSTKREAKSFTFEKWEEIFEYIKIFDGLHGKYARAAKCFGVDKETIRRRFLADQKNETRYGPECTLSDQVEIVLVQLIFERFNCGFALSIRALQKAARRLAELDNIPNFIACRSWVDRFLNRHPQVKLRIAEFLEYFRVINTSRDFIARYFQILRVALEGVEPRNIYMMDETSIELRNTQPTVSIFCPSESIDFLSEEMSIY